MTRVIRSILPIGLLLMSALFGCDRLWGGALGCDNGSAPVKSEDGNMTCAGSDVDAGSSADAGWTVSQWPTAPMAVPLPTMSGAPYTSLRIADGVNSSSPKVLNAFMDSQLSFVTAIGTLGCPYTGTAMAPTTLGGIVYDANTVNTNQGNYGYTIYNTATNPAKMTLAMEKSTTPFTVPLSGTSRPGWSYIDYDPNRTPILTIINTTIPGFYIGFANTATPTFGSVTFAPGLAGLSIHHVAHADFNKDGFPDFIMSGVAGGVGGRWACISNGGLCPSANVQALADENPTVSTNEFLAASPSKSGMRLIRVRVSSGSGSKVSMSEFGTSGTPGAATLHSYPDAYTLPAQPPFEPMSLAVYSTDTSDNVSVFIAGADSNGKSAVFALKLDSAGALAGPVQALPLMGPPKVMVLGRYPCLDRQQLVIASGSPQGVWAYDLTGL